MKAAIYCRLSRDDQAALKQGDEAESIQNQRSMLLQYAEAQGFSVYKVYCDENYSGADSSRPAFNEMISDAKSRFFSIILVKTQSRFARDIELAEHYINSLFPQWGVRFIAVADHIDTATRHSKKSSQIHSLINEWYLEDLSANIRSVLKHKRMEGQYTGALAPYGYTRDPEQKNHLIVDEEAAAVVRKIYALFLAGYSAAAIAQSLEEEHIPTPSVYKFQHGIYFHTPSNSRWDYAAVLSILHRDTYTGNLVQSKTTPISCKTRRRKKVSPAEQITVCGTHEPIISPPLFNLVQDMCGVAGSSRRYKKVSPLSGKLVCAVCGCKLLINGHELYAYYTCGGHLTGKFPCAAPASIRKSDIEALILDKIQRHIEPLIAADFGFTAMPNSANPVVLKSSRQPTEYRIKEYTAPPIAADCTHTLGALCSLWNDLPAPSALSRALVYLIIEKITIHHKSHGDKTQDIEITWHF